MKITLTGTDKQVNKNYDKIFKILDQHALFVKSSTLSEKETTDGYEIAIDRACQQATSKIEQLNQVKVEY